MMNLKAFTSPLFALILFSCISAYANKQAPICADTYGWKYGNFFANCVSEHTALLAVKMPKQVRKCTPPTYAFLGRAYAACLQNNFIRARRALALPPRICGLGNEELFHPHTDQKWTSCTRRQLSEIEAAL